jgi:hypothetical protein
MWSAIQYVTGGASLVAFLAAVTAWAYRSHMVAREHLIAKLPKEDRYKAAQDLLENLKIDTKHLTNEQKYDLAKAQIRARERRYAIAAGVICLLVLLFGLLTALIIRHEPDAPRAAQLRINGVFPGDKPDAEVQITAFVNGEVFTYPGIAGVQWMKIGPNMAPMRFDVTPAQAYVLRFEGKLRTHDRTQTLFDLADNVTEYPLASQTEQVVTRLPFTVKYPLFVVDPQTSSRSARVGAVVDAELSAETR